MTSPNLELSKRLTDIVNDLLRNARYGSELRLPCHGRADIRKHVLAHAEQFVAVRHLAEVLLVDARY
ncbi:MAG: hypothetical protein ACN6OP_13600 [Pseudomonadales bacterium]